MRVVLDSNVLVAAVAVHGACAELFERVLTAHEYGIDENLVEEVLRVLGHKFRLPGDRVSDVRSLLTTTGVSVVAPRLEAPVCRDPDDDRVLALARAFRAEVLVTGDADLLILHPWSGIPILRPRDFWPMDRAARR